MIPVQNTKLVNTKLMSIFIYGIHLKKVTGSETAQSVVHIQDRYKKTAGCITFWKHFLTNCCTAVTKLFPCQEKMFSDSDTETNEMKFMYFHKVSELACRAALNNLICTCPPEAKRCCQTGYSDETDSWTPDDMRGTVWCWNNWWSFAAWFSTVVSKMYIKHDWVKCRSWICT